MKSEQMNNLVLRFNLDAEKVGKSLSKGTLILDHFPEVAEEASQKAESAKWATDPLGLSRRINWELVEVRRNIASSLFWFSTQSERLGNWILGNGRK